MKLALYQPEIAHNTGALMRLSACWGFELAIIHPVGFVISDKRLKRAGMDYVKDAMAHQYDSWEDFLLQHSHNRILAFVPHVGKNHWDFEYRDSDVLLLGKESSGFPESVVKSCDEVLSIPCNGRSLNLSMCGAIAMCAVRNFIPT